MSLTTTSNRNDYTGTNSTATYAYTYRIFAATDLDVKVKNLAGVVTTLTYPSGYSVSNVGNVSGGNIVLTAGNLATGFKLIIRRIRPMTQTTSIKNETAYYAKTHEDTFDKITMLLQQLNEASSRSVQINPGDSGFDPTLPSNLQADRSLIVGPDGLSFVLGPTPDELVDASAAVAAAEAAKDTAVLAATAANADAAAAAAALTAALLAQAGAVSAKNAAEAARDIAVAAAAGQVVGGPLTVASGANANLGYLENATNYDALDYSLWARGTNVRSRFFVSVAYDGSSWVISQTREEHLKNIADVTFTINASNGNVNLANNSGVSLNANWKISRFPTI